MVSFESDYTTGAHPEVLKRLIETNEVSVTGYGTDVFCDRAKEKIRAAIGMEDAQIEFITGGTQTNAVVIATMLADYEGVIAAQTGHISAHEASAIEYTGHEVLTLPQEEGKIKVKDLIKFLEDYYADESHEHMPFSGMVYLSHPTEYGTLYTKTELEGIAEICHRYEMSLYLDGARLGYGLMSMNTDITLHDIAEICDVFYIGGTKMGALCGEAVVFTKNNMPKHFITSMKKRGALLAKGRLLGVQFDALFTEDLYFKIGRQVVERAEEMKEIFRKHEIPFFLDSPTNQQFVILENRQMETIREQAAFSYWQKYDETHTVVRFAVGWSTTQEDLKVLEAALKES